MPWWVASYLAVYLGLTGVTLVQQRRRGAPAWRLLAEAGATGVLCWLAVAGWWRPLPVPPGPVAVASFVAALAWGIREGAWQLRELREEGDAAGAGEGVQWVAVVLGAALTAPAFALAALGVERALHGG